MIPAELLERAQASADESLRKDGVVNARIYLHHVRGDCVAIPYKIEGIPLGFQRAVIKRTIAGLNREGLFGGALLISEAWMARHKKENAPLATVIPPSLDPDRIEIVTALAIAVDGTKSLRCWEIDRSGPFPRCGKVLESDFESLETWLDDAFKEVA